MVDMMSFPETVNEFIMSFTEQEVLSLIEILNRANQIKNPPLMYYHTALKLEKKISETVKRQIDSKIMDFSILNN